MQVIKKHIVAILATTSVIFLITIGVLIFFLNKNKNKEPQKETVYTTVEAVNLDTLFAELAIIQYQMDDMNKKINTSNRRTTRIETKILQTYEENDNYVVAHDYGELSSQVSILLRAIEEIERKRQVNPVKD